jgi:hypothetical protein
MTTLELYRKHKAGDVSREKFLYEVRRDNNIPWVLNTTSYDDAIKILKNKGIISEDNSTLTKGVGKVVEPSSIEMTEAPNTLTISQLTKLAAKAGQIVPDAEADLNDLSGYGDNIPKEKVMSVLANYDIELADLKDIKPKKEKFLSIDDLMNRGYLEETSPQDAKAVEDAINTGKIDPEKVKAAAEKAEKGDPTDLALLMLNAGRLFEAKKGKKKQPKELHIDVANPYEYRHGIQHELTEMDDYSAEALEKAKSKVLKNLAKDPLFYSTLLNAKQSPYTFKAPETDKPGMQAKADGHLKKELKKDEKANVKDTLGKKEEGSKHPKGVKEMTMTPKKAKGIKKTMAVPGKEKTIKEGLEVKNDDNFSLSMRKQKVLGALAADALFGDKEKISAIKKQIEDATSLSQLVNILHKAGYKADNIKTLLKKDNPNKPVTIDEHYVDFFLAEDRAMFADEPADAEKYKIKKDLKGKIVQATNDEGDIFSMNDEAIAIDNGQKIKIAGFEESQGKVKALYNAGMFFSSIDIDGLKPANKGFRPGVDLGKSFEKFKGIKEYIKSKLKTEDAAKDNQAKQAAIVAAGKELDALRSQLSGINNDTGLNPDEKNKKKAFLQSKINDATKRAADLRSGKVTYP